MYPLLFVTAAALAPAATGAPSAADSGPLQDATPYTFKYEHRYKRKSKKHKDKLAISRGFANGIELGIEEILTPRKQSDGSPGHAYKHLRHHETKFVFAYKHKLSPRVAIKPKLRLELKKHETTYREAIKLPIKLTQHLKLEPGFEYRGTHYDASGRGKKSRTEPSIQLAWTIGDFKLELRRKQIFSNRIIYNNKKHDYQNRLAVKYAMTDNFTPYVDVRDVSVDSTSDRRQAEIRTGFSYAF